MSRNEPLPPQRVAIYARQSVAEEQGIDQQVKACRAEAENRGWVVIGEYPDDATSGTKERESKTNWARMLKDYDNGLFDVLMVTETSRLTRRLTDILEVTPPKRGMRIIVRNQGIDTAKSDFSLKLLILIAEEEVKLKTQRAQVYAVERRKVGHPTAGKTPHGYRWVPAINRDKKGTRYKINEDKAQDVRQIFKEFLAGASLGQIARDLNSADRKPRTGKRWVTSTIRRILMNPQYAALLPPAQETGKHDLASISLEQCTEGAWAPIIDADHVKATRARLVGVKPNHNGTTPRWLLSGLAVCSVCKMPVRSARGETQPTARVDGSGSAPKKRYHAYRCVEGHFMRNGDIIDEFVAELCIAYISDPENIQLLTRPSKGPDIGVLHTERNALNDRESIIASMIATGKMTEKSAVGALDDLAAQKRDIDSQIANAVKISPMSELIGVQDVRAWWADASLARRQGMIKLLMAVEIRPVGYGRRIASLEAAAETVGIIWEGTAKP